MNKVIQLGGSAAFIPTFENAAYGIEWTKDDNDMFIIIMLLLNMIGVFMLKIEKKMSNLKHNIL